MPVQTINYLLSAFLDGDIYSANADKRRFTTIDNQMNIVSEIIGNGRIEGWTIEQKDFPTVTVKAGNGLIDKYYVNTFDDQDVELSSNGQFFFYAQRRVGIIGTVGPRSDVEDISYSDDGPPSAPGGFIAEVPLSDPYFTILLSWDANTEVDLDHYDIERSTSVDSDFVLISQPSKTEIFYEDSVKEDTTYYYRLYAVDQSGNRSEASGTQATTDISPLLPSNPVNVTFPASEGGINVLWNRPPGTLFNNIDRWELEYVELNSDGSTKDDTLQLQIINKEIYYERIDNLNLGQLYKFTLYTVDSKQRRSTGISKNISPQPNPAPRDPQGIGFSFEEGPSGVRINASWTDGATPYDDAIPYRYNIYVFVDGQEFESAAINVPIGFTEEQIDLYSFNLIDYFPIPENTLVTLRITSVNQAGEESFGNYVKFLTPVFALPLRVRNLKSVFNFDTSQILVSWDNQPDTSSIFLTISDDDLNDAYTTDFQIVNTNIGLAERYVFNAELDHKYTIRVTSVNSEGIEGPTSTTVTLTVVPDIEPPAAPISLNAQANDRKILLTWTASPDIVTSEYKIYRKLGSVSVIPDAWNLIETLPKTKFTFDDYGLQNGQTYAYYITAVDIYGQESFHLPDNNINLNFIEATPKQQGILTEPLNVSAELVGTNVLLTWETLLEEFDAFSIYRSINNLHSWELIATVDRNTVSYTDISLPLIDGTTFYYTVDKAINDSDIVVQTTDNTPENAIFLASIETGESSFISSSISNRRDIQDMLDPLAEYTSKYIIPHRHRETEFFDAQRIDLNPELIITDWFTFDGRVWLTNESDIVGSTYIVKVNNRFPNTFYKIDPILRRLVFSEPVVTIDADTGEIVGTAPDIEVRILGIEEVTNVLNDDKINNLHARQIAFGRLGQEQIPNIGHEGRIREKLLPKRFLLERFSNHHFVVPETNDDETKTLGDGTTFYAAIESDGLIQEVVDFDLENDGDIVTFRKPSFSSETILNLKQNQIDHTLEDENDNANEHIFDDATASWFPGPGSLMIGDFGTYKTDTYLRYSVSVPVGSTVSVSNIIFTSHNTEISQGDNAKLQVSILDPSKYSQSVDLSTESIKLVADLNDPILWNPPVWDLNERSDNTTLDVTSMVQEFVNLDSYTEGDYIIFRIKTSSLNFDDHHRIAFSFADSANAPILETNHIIDVAEVNSDPGGFQSEKSYHLRFEFEDNEPTRWVQVTTFDAPIVPNPIIDLRKRLRFRMLLETGSIYVALGIRELDISDAAIGDNGGTSGPIEWSGVSEFVSDDEANIAPLGKLIKAQEGVWQEIEFDIPNENSISFFDGDGILGSNFGTLEHLAFTINPDDDNATGPFDVYFDKIEQISDLAVAGTSQGILLSRDFGTSWESSRLTDTPVHKFYKATNNRFLWAITGNQVLFAVDPAYWFVTTGTTGVQFIRDITEDSDGNMYISTDKGVYWFEIALILTFAEWRQTQPITAFTTDCYGLYHNAISSGEDEIWVSTEIGIYKTSNQGRTWTDANLSTGGLAAYQFIDISSDSAVPNLIAINRKHVLRKLSDDLDFKIIANFEEQHNIFDIWKITYFADRLYVSTGSGVYISEMDELFSTSPVTIIFDRILYDLDFNGQTGIAFGMDVVQVDEDKSQLFIGQESRLMVAEEDNTISIKKQFANRELPSFYLDNEEISIGYIYNAFNNVVVFREPQPVNQIVSAANLPRKQWVPINGGWAETNADTDVFIYFNGIPKWLDFKLDQAQILSEIQITEGKLLEVQGQLTDFNSLLSKAQELLSSTLNSISTIREGGLDEEENPSPLINSVTIRSFVENYTRFLSLITTSLSQEFGLDIFPKIHLAGFDKTEREPNSRAEILENKEDFESKDTTNIFMDSVSGEVDFLLAFSGATNPENRAEFTFNKYDNMQISIFNSNVTGSGEFTHRELEDRMEDINTGLTSDLARSHSTNLIKLGVFLEGQNNFLFDRFNVSNIQSNYYAAHTNNWYDILNSTIDYNTIVNVPNIEESHIVYDAVFFTDDPYFANKLWVATDSDIIQYQFDDEDGVLVSEKIVRPGNGSTSLTVLNIFTLNQSSVYVVAEEKDTKVGRIYLTENFGSSWLEIDTINLPQQIYAFTIINGNLVAATEEGMFYSDNSFGTWFPGDVVPSDLLGDEHESLDDFNKRTFNLEKDTFLIAETQRFFYTSGSGVEWFAVGPSSRLNNNGLRSVNKVVRFNNLTWIGTDKGLYNDANSILSDQVQFGLQDIEVDLAKSATINISDITHGSEALYCSGSNNRIYRFFDEDTTDELGNEWKSYLVPDIETIHKIFLLETDNKHWMFVFAHDKIKIVDVTPETGVFA